MSETQTAASARNGQRKVREGEVISNKSNKTVVVRISRRVGHTRYKKIITVHKKFHVHDEKNEAQLGDAVDIMETRPLSKTKRWRLLRIVKRGELALAAERGTESAA